MESNGEAPSSPFWFQPPTTVHPRRRRPQPTPLLNPAALIITTSVLALLVLFFLLPSFLSHAIQFLRPNSVKKSWDSLNILLVLFAILCGVYARWNEESPPPGHDGLADHRINSGGVSNVSNFVNRPRPSVSAWMGSPDRRQYGAAGNVSGGGSGLRRSSSSYPDLRQESLWDSGGNRPSRFFDDFEVNFYRSPTPELRRRRSHEAEREEAETIVREISVDKFEVSSAPPPPTLTPPKSPTPPAPPPPKANLKRRRSLRSVPRKEKVERQRDEAEVSNKQRPVPPPAPPSPQPPVEVPGEPSVEVHRKKNGATKEFATAIASLYKGQRKRKNRVKSRNIYVSAAESSSPPPSAVEPQSAPPPPPGPPVPPPPPPPPTSKVFQNPFKRSGKSKRVHSVSVSTTAPPPPPPPPPLDSIFNNLFKTGSISKRFLQSSAPHSTTAPPPPPPPPPPSSIFNTIFKNGPKNRRSKNITTSPPPPPPPLQAAEAVAPRRRPLNSGKPPKPTKPVIIAPPSPLIPLPPPPPPFRMAEAKFVAQGDYVRIRSTHSSRGSSPELEDVDVMSVKSDGGDSIGPSVSCPSPDVNAKADSFIARLRDEWKLEKMNSVREKRRFI